MNVDPTRIDIETDPTTKRMRGVAYHGNTPFDVPYISELADNLWQGGCEDGLVLPDFIRHVVSLYPWERYTINNGASYTPYKMYDSLDQAMDQVHDIAGLVNDLRKDGPVLVHCQAGLNRSSLIAARALYLESLGELTGDEIVEIIRERRSPACLCNPAFEEEVRSWGRL